MDRVGGDIGGAFPSPTLPSFIGKGLYDKELGFTFRMT